MWLKITTKDEKLQKAFKFLLNTIKSIIIDHPAFNENVVGDYSVDTSTEAFARSRNMLQLADLRTTVNQLVLYLFLLAWYLVHYVIRTTFYFPHEHWYNPVLSNTWHFTGVSRVGFLIIYIEQVNWQSKNPLLDAKQLTEAVNSRMETFISLFFQGTKWQFCTLFQRKRNLLPVAKKTELFDKICKHPCLNSEYLGYELKSWLRVTTASVWSFRES